MTPSSIRLVTAKEWPGTPGGEYRLEIKHECPMRPWEKDGQTTFLLPLNREGWQLQNYDPITVTPSIMCGDCGLHGWVRNGTWVAV